MNIQDPHLNARDRARLVHGLVRVLELHGMDGRKGSGDQEPTVPYVSHLLGVAALVMEHEGTVDQVLAGLLHDAVEDKAHIAPETLEHEFNAAVAQMVADCSDSVGDPDNKPPWEERKQAYVDALAGKIAEKRDSVLVTACDKLHNLSALVADVGAHGIGYLDRFNAKPGQQLWYYESLVAAFEGAPEELVPKRLKVQLRSRLGEFKAKVEGAGYVSRRTTSE